MAYARTPVARAELAELAIGFDSGVLGVERVWDDVGGGLPDPKTDVGRRDIPLAGRLKTELARHKLATGRGADDLCFGRAPDLAFDRATVARRARTAWLDANLMPVTPHEARHTCASYLIAAGVDDMQLQRYIGHTEPRPDEDRDEYPTAWARVGERPSEGVGARHQSSLMDGERQVRVRSRELPRRVTQTPMRGPATALDLAHSFG